MSQELRTQFYRTVKVWKDLEVPYEHRGITQRGCDCTGLVIGVLRELGFLMNYQLRKYPKDWNLHARADDYITQELEKVAYEIHIPQPGDLVTFYFGKCVAHVGVVIERGLFVHCNRTSQKCIISALQNSQWTPRIHGFYRIDWSKL